MKLFVLPSTVTLQNFRISVVVAMLRAGGAAGPYAPANIYPQQPGLRAGPCGDDAKYSYVRQGNYCYIPT